MDIQATFDESVGTNMGSLSNAIERFEAMFRQATGNPVSLPYQKHVALGDHFPTLLDVPTGLKNEKHLVLFGLRKRL